MKTYYYCDLDRMGQRAELPRANRETPPVFLGVKNQQLKYRKKKKANKYQSGKAAAREMAIDWQLSFSEKTYYWSDIAYWSDYFTRLGRRYGLLREFRTEGII